MADGRTKEMARTKHVLRVAVLTGEIVMANLSDYGKPNSASAWRMMV
jgi:hypothetical protein